MQPNRAEAQAWRGVADLYHDIFLGLVLTVLSRKSEADAAEFVFNILRRQQREKFHDGLRKLGIEQDPPAVAAAKYHYLSNKIGGVDVDYMYESDSKAWIRYAPPRWLWKGVAMCAIPRKVSEAMLWGWHANNGMMLNRPSVGFVCTKQGVDAQDGLEGYYCDYGRDLERSERLRFARGESAPAFDPAAAPQLASDDWPAARLAKAHRNYAMEYAKSAMLESVNTFGPIEGEGLMRQACRIVGMQGFRALAAALGQTDRPLADFIVALVQAQGDRIDRSGPEAGPTTLTQTGWTLIDRQGDFLQECRVGYGELMVGLASGHSRFHNLDCQIGGTEDQSRFAFSLPAC
ncbi:hypothetical protein [Pseudooceanicola sp.]|uniref:hypothetical protein n=1 Tax=Pseudooceanicola sp. TaxID=1914328 RepID=UPI00263198D1|nr:hypothetical protein [Pseudooceanicola sp.]MDF1855421.1 hypothetical protein [Pseudooceanicola sp.]